MKMDRLLLILLSILVISCGQKQEYYDGPLYSVVHEIKETGGLLTAYIYLKDQESDTLRINKALREVAKDRKDFKVMVYAYTTKEEAESKSIAWLAKMDFDSKILNNENYATDAKIWKAERKKKLDEKKKQDLREILKAIDNFKPRETFSYKVDFKIELESFDKLISKAKVDKADKESVDLFDAVMAKYNLKRESIQQKMRKKYVTLRGEELWRDDFKISSSGNNSNITFINYRFASNAAIQDFHKEELTFLKLLGFKKASYKWIDYGEYTYYEIE